MSPVARLLAGCALLLGTTAGPAPAYHPADAGYLVMTRAMDWPGTWASCPYGVGWAGRGTAALAGQEPGTYALWIYGSTEKCGATDEHGSIWVSGDDVYGELTYARVGTNVGIGGWLEVAGHRHRVGASEIVAVPTSVLPTTTDLWTGLVVLR